jgi:DNA polymerase-1
VWAVRDASQQELRLLGHFAGGGLAASYRADPWVDLHQLVATTIGTSTGTVVDRGRGKTINFAVVYGVGNAHLAELLGCTYEAAKSLKRTYFQLFPEVKDVYDEMKRRARAREPIRTLGGREYLCEEPQVVAGRLRTFDYKLPNLLIQGSAADHMKRSLRRFARAAAPGWRLRLTVHDEVAVSCPPAELDAAMACLRAALDDEPLDVPMLSEGKTGPSLGALTPYDRAGRRC